MDFAFASALQFVDDFSFDKNWFEPITVPFEDRKYVIPKDYDKILTRQFGDYMTPPPKEEQVGHGGGKVILSFTKDVGSINNYLHNVLLAKTIISHNKSI